MKVVHIGSNTTGGAGLGMMGLHQALLAAGVDSKVVTLRVNPGEEADPSIEIVAPEVDFVDPIGDAVESIRKKYRLPVSSPYSGVRVEDLSFVREADIVHLHWVAGLVDYKRFFASIDKPIVWTFRDENAMLGLYHVEQDRPIDPTEEERRLDAELKIQKTEWINGGCDLTFVSLSQGMKGRVDASAIGGRESFVIPNRIDTAVFCPRDRGKIREEFKIDAKETVLLFVAQFIGTRHKGLRELFVAMETIASESRSLTLLCVGNGKVEFTAPANVKVVYAGPTTDRARLAEFYSAADLFVAPSYSETFGKTTAEAIACGTPVVSFPNMGAHDIIEDGVDGFITDDFTPSALARAIEKALSHRFDQKVMIERIKDRYSQEIIVRRHMELYEHIIKTPRRERVAKPVSRRADVWVNRSEENPRLSIITICRNNAEDLRKTLWSTLHDQPNCDDFEQIVVDGGSTDGTKEVIATYKDCLGWYCSEPDRGIYDAMNKGAKHARGEYLLFLNAGDVLLADMLKKVMREPFQEDIVYADIYFMTGGKLTKFVSPNPAEITPGWFLFNSLPHQATFIRRDLHNRLGGYDAAMKISAAPKFIFQALFAHRCSYRKLDCAFSVFDRSGISSQPKMLSKKLEEWLSFLTPYYGHRVASSAMQWLTISKVIDRSVCHYLERHPEDFGPIREHLRRFVAARNSRGNSDWGFAPRRKLSVITVCKNDRAGLERTLKSVLEEQEGFGDFEQIVVDGGSTDGSKEVIETYRDRLAWSCSERDSGIYNAMNKGVRHSSGEYLLFLNSGDALRPNALKRIFGAHVVEDIVYADMYIRSGNHVRLSPQANVDELTEGWFLFNTLPHQAAFIRRTLHELLGGYDESLRISAAPKFFFEAVVRFHCTIRKLEHPFSVFDTGGISSRSEHLVEKASDWFSFLAPYFGVRVAERAREFMLMRNGDLSIEAIRESPIPVLRGDDIELARLRSSFVYRVWKVLTSPRRIVERTMMCYHDNGLAYTIRRILFGRRY